ncbi:hypothetical protein Hanom_Chr09g00845511 [Helianthus anomalus]
MAWLGRLSIFVNQGLSRRCWISSLSRLTSPVIMMADALEAACNDPLPAYADFTKHVAEDGVDALRLMLEPVEELSDIF